MKMFLYEKEVYLEASVLASQNLNHLFIINKLFWTNYFELTIALNLCYPLEFFCYDIRMVGYV